MLALTFILLALGKEVLLAPMDKDTCIDKEPYGIELAGNGYSCSRLLQTSDRIGIFKNREDICAGRKAGVTQFCCATCQCVKEKIRPAETTGDAVTETFCKDTCTDKEPYGIELAETSYSCSRLLQPNDTSGIYKNRDKICAGNSGILQDCCETCRHVKTEVRVTTTTATIIETTVIPANTETPRPDECVDEEIRMADGWYACTTLLDTTDTSGIYTNRVGVCNGKINTVLSDCCNTCKTVLKEEKAMTDEGKIVVADTNTDNIYAVPSDETTDTVRVIPLEENANRDAVNNGLVMMEKMNVILRTQNEKLAALIQNIYQTLIGPFFKYQ